MNYLRRNRLYCAKCHKRKSKVTHDKATKMTTAVCDTERGGCGAEIPLYKDEYGKYHPVRCER